MGSSNSFRGLREWKTLLDLYFRHNLGPYGYIYRYMSMDKSRFMKHRKRIKYLIVATLSAALSIVILTGTMFQKEEKNQSRMESTLPFGDYLPDAENPLIRVVIKSDGFASLAHSEVTLSAVGGLIFRFGEEFFETEDILTLRPDDERFAQGSIVIVPCKEEERITINSLSRGYGTPSYRGKMELFSTAEGIVIVNELPLEEYLYAVVPSEMPASYAKEALKCQAVCARSYAYCQMLTFAYPQYLAHVYDSVSFQVYGNSREQESTTQAVRETIGEKLWYGGKVVKTYYYSTSCGYSTDVEAWGSTVSEQTKYLTGVPICNEGGKAYEEGLPWYRWRAVIPKETLCELIELNIKTEIGKLKESIVAKRGTGGVVLELVIRGSKGDFAVRTENKIRAALGGSGYTITKQDGTVVNSSSLLPSAFFEIRKDGEQFVIEGGGYGHGIGMSQNGANEMAKEGKNYREILTFFSSGAKVD